MMRPGVIALVLALPLALVRGQNGSGERPRYSVEDNVRCHSKPALDSTSSDPIRLGTEIRSTRETQAGGQTWYFSESCWLYGPGWVYGPGTETFDAIGPERLLLGILDHILARKDVKVDEYVEVENFMQDTARMPPSSMPALFRFRWLQLVERVVETGEMQNSDQGAAGAPFRKAWMLSHNDLLQYYEPDAAWYVDSDQFWTLYEANKKSPWADELAWVASTLPTHTDECYSSCQLQQLTNRPLQYWTRYPAGRHVKDALNDGADRARAVAQDACRPGDPGSEVDPDDLEEIRDSLAEVTDPGKEPILNSLADIERKCRK